MPPNLSVYIDPADFDRRVRGPRRNWMWTLVVMALAEIGYVATEALTGPPAYFGAVGIGFGSFLVAGWVERWWRRYHTVPLDMVCDKVSELRGELTTVQKGHDELLRQLSDRQRNQALADELQEEWSYGLHSLLNADVTTVKKFAKYGFEEKERDWMRRLLETMKEHSCTAQEISHVSDLHAVDGGVLHRSGDHYINVALDRVSTRLYRIRDIINDHTAKPA